MALKQYECHKSKRFWKLRVYAVRYSARSSIAERERERLCLSLVPVRQK